MYHYKKNLLRHYDSLANRGLFILITETPWEWRLGKDYLIEIREDNQDDVEKALQSLLFLKIHRYLKFDEPAVQEGLIVEEALSTFRMLKPLITTAS